jgi:hypothetical protein
VGSTASRTQLDFAFAPEDRSLLEDIRRGLVGMLELVEQQAAKRRTRGFLP